MKILYISSGQGVDYQADVVFHGLRSLFGTDVVDFPRVWHMYEDSFGEGKAKKSDLYGRGFTYSGLFPSDEGVDRDDLPAKIESKFFDLIIYGSIHRNQTWFSGVTTFYPPSKVAFIDGEDHPYVMLLQKYGVMFKRELFNPMDGIYPIQFGMPKEKILKEPPAKTQFVSSYDPLLNRNYVYDNEADYYKQYADSYFAATMKKGGWECLRHTEILANWSIPYFRCFEACPALVMRHMPRKELLLIKNLIEYGTDAGFNGARYMYDFFIENLMKAMNEHMTTEAIARDVLDTMKSVVAA